MINAFITDANLGATNEGLIFAIFSFRIKNEDVKNPYKILKTQPIFLMSKDEDINSSGVARGLIMIFNAVGTNNWEGLTGSAVQLEVGENNKILKIANLLDDNNYITLESSAQNDEVPEAEAEIVEE